MGRLGGRAAIGDQAAAFVVYRGHSITGKDFRDVGQASYFTFQLAKSSQLAVAALDFYR